MKLADIFEIDLNPVSVQRQFEPPRGKLVGAGIQSMVFPHPNDPNFVVKSVTIIDPRREGYVKYVALVLDHQNNPFFPKIKHAKLYKLPPQEETNNAKYKMVVVMEKLHRLKEMEDLVPEAFEQLGISREYIDFDPRSTKLLDFMSNSHNRQMLRSTTTNSQFRQALELLEPLLLKHKPDLRVGNLMFRLTGGQPQLVIIDPFYMYVGEEV